MATGMNEPEDGPTSAKLLKLLECPFCFESPMIQPVYQCETGHSVCSNCWTKLDKCGVCQKQFTGTRNYVAEHIAESFKFYCKHKDEGCTVVNTRQELFRHQLVCPYRPVLCNYIRTTSCKNNSVKLGDFFLHLKNVHECPGNDDYKGGSFKLIQTSSLSQNSGPSSPRYYVKFNEKYFVLETLFDENTVDWGVYLIGTSEQAKKYRYELTILPTKESLLNQNVEIIYKLPVSSVYDQFNKTWNGGLASCLKASLKSLSITEGIYPDCLWKWDIVVKIIDRKEDPVAQSKYTPLSLLLRKANCEGLKKAAG